MREVPWDVRRELHSRDPEADVFWDAEIHRWVLSWRKRRVCVLFHEDGTDMLELCASEILGLLDRFDNFKDGPDRLKAMRRVAADARHRAEIRREFAEQESMREAERMAKSIAAGPKVQIEIHKKRELKNAQGQRIHCQCNAAATGQREYGPCQAG